MTNIYIQAFLFSERCDRILHWNYGIPCPRCKRAPCYLADLLWKSVPIATYGWIFSRVKWLIIMGLVSVFSTSVRVLPGFYMEGCNFLM
ncbi:hypothetical protein GDO81_017147 [Engystomops pustulosus]|uniref:Uncharacterized protein n=1 Tax=Engystomops pustulosus TaxID=76066 RepID=A0AAV7AC17_ENGPU|nr:hypothetical protein GDO81_017147 [Engystomops pustulosus]